MTIISTLAYKLLGLFIPIRNEIYLESKPIFSDNTYSLYKEMIERGVNRHYKLRWILDEYDLKNHSKLPDHLPENVDIVKFDPRKPFWKVTRMIVLLRGKLYISSNHYYGGRQKGQFNLYLNHGAPLKDTGIYNKKIPECDAEIVLSQYLIPITAIDSNMPEDSLIATGFPRNDSFFMKKPIKKADFSCFSSFEMVVAWLPTFRQNWDGVRVDCESGFPFGIPIIKTKEDFELLNEELKRTNTLLIIKIHFAQDLSQVFQSNFSNIVFYTNENLEKLGLQLNEFLSFTDGLITDYSSVYFDYLLANKPIGLTIDDLDQYLKTPGIRYDDYFEAIKGKYISDMEGLIHYLNETVPDRDVSALAGMTDRYHDFRDGKSSARVLDYLRKIQVID